MCLSGRSLSSLQVKSRCQKVSEVTVRLTITTPAFFLASKESLMFWVSRRTWSSVDFPRRNPSYSLGSSGAMDRSQWLDTGVDKPLEDLVGDAEQRYWSITVWVPHRHHWLRNRHYKRFSLDRGNFESAQGGRNKVT